MSAYITPWLIPNISDFVGAFGGYIENTFQLNAHLRDIWKDVDLIDRYIQRR